MPGVKAMKEFSSFLNDHLGALIVAVLLSMGAQTLYAYGRWQVFEDRWDKQGAINEQTIKLTEQVVRLTATLNERDRQESLKK